MAALGSSGAGAAATVMLKLRMRGASGKMMWWRGQVQNRTEVEVMAPVGNGRGFLRKKASAYISSVPWEV